MDHHGSSDDPASIARQHLPGQWAIRRRYAGYYAGGYDGRNYLSTIERYNELECRWQIVCEMMEQRCTFGLAENHRSDGFYVFGGFAHEPLATC